MVTGASTANLAIILIDARHGVIEQTCRHAFIASLLQIKHIVVCVNKMDLVDYSQESFEKIKKDFKDFSSKLDIPDIRFIPISALLGDNIVNIYNPATCGTYWHFTNRTCTWSMALPLSMCKTPNKVRRLFIACSRSLSRR
jgi:sulfate adenylyltransferase subunit 1 (EFTu-like GTPase family)